MAALLGADLEKAKTIAGAAVDAILAEGGEELVCTVANDNDPSQVVISGHRAAIEKAVALARTWAPSARSCCRCQRRSTAR